ncbi:hypothetical protein QR680_012646 [Steinernema hermaphroditum]|uniref:Uncharacterized protein n=1 Tax=Steinernema hermaphroditum TaxID=289476 RepID=A0AA39M138_9BILA|nr:hypothetical protein QR680_012646 [Steinernema hermaphroditum]
MLKSCRTTRAADRIDVFAPTPPRFRPLAARSRWYLPGYGFIQGESSTVLLPSQLMWTQEVQEAVSRPCLLSEFRSRLFCSAFRSGMPDVRFLQREVVPIPGREVVQRNFANLLKNGHQVGKEKYSFRRLSLNERFTLMYRGYVLREAQQAEAPEGAEGRRKDARRNKNKKGQGRTERKIDAQLQEDPPNQRTQNAARTERSEAEEEETTVP